MEEKSGFGYFLLGLGVGVAAGILWAPRAGEETRQLLADRASDGADYLKDRAQQGGDFVRQRAQEGSEYVRQRAHEGGDYVRNRADEVKHSASDLYEKGRTAVNRQKDNLNTAVEAGKQAYRDAVTDFKSATAGDSGASS